MRITRGLKEKKRGEGWRKKVEWAREEGPFRARERVDEPFLASTMEKEAKENGLGWWGWREEGRGGVSRPRYAIPGLLIPIYFF